MGWLVPIKVGESGCLFGIDCGFVCTIEKLKVGCLKVLGYDHHLCITAKLVVSQG